MSKARENVQLLNSLGFDVTAAATPAAAAAFCLANNKPLIIPPGSYAFGTLSVPGLRVYAHKGATWTGALNGAVIEWEQRQATATTASVAAVEFARQASDVLDVTELGGLWSEKVYFGNARVKEFTAANTPVSVSNLSPSVAGLDYAINNGSNTDIVANMAIARANTNGRTVFAYNGIALAPGTLTNVKAVGAEFDVQYSTTSTSSGTGGGIFLNVFHATSVGAAIQIEAAGTAGTWSNGVLIKSVASGGTLFGALSGASCSTGLDLSQGSFSNAAVLLNRAQVAKWSNGTSNPVAMFGDTSNNFFINPGDTLYVTAPTSTENVQFFVPRKAGGEQSVVFYTTSGADLGNTAGAAIRVNKNSSTSRSINAGGTINASGTDYAEYETKSDTCGIFAKGDIVGFDANGLLTDKYDEAISFAVKSTNPSYVGGDNWDAGGVPNDPPVAPNDPLPHPVRANTIRDATLTDDELEAMRAAWKAEGKTVSEISVLEAKAHQERNELMATIDATYQRELREWQADQDRHAREMEVYNAAMALHRASEQERLAKSEERRQRVDRIAYCGKVPVNVYGASPGDCIVPARTASGGIEGQVIQRSAATIEDKLRAVGHVKRILSDGRAEIIVSNLGVSF
jgi:hypothetical protein